MIAQKISTFLHCFIVNDVPRSDPHTLHKGDVLVGLSFGFRGSGRPGTSNDALAQITRELYEVHDVPLVLQWEIADSLSEAIPVVKEISGKTRTSLFPAEGTLQTRRVLHEAWEFCHARGKNKAIIVAHPRHQWRIARAAQKLGFHTAIADCRDVPYDERSLQFWTRDKRIHRFYEIGARLYYLWKGWI